MSNSSGLPIFGINSTRNVRDLDPMWLPGVGSVSYNELDFTDVGNYLDQALDLAGCNGAWDLHLVKVVSWLVVEAGLRGALRGITRRDFKRCAALVIRLRSEADRIAYAYNVDRYDVLALQVKRAADLLDAVNVFSNLSHSPFTTEA
jgi:hypothetical protein